jgi:tRNA-specific 2-thiouridylase
MFKKRVLLGMSGGLDSTVAAYLLKKEGYEVIGAFMHFWSEEYADSRRENACCSVASLEDARRVANFLGIDFYVLNTSDKFKDEIVDPWISDSLAGTTPNACLFCNRLIKIGHLLKRARELDCEYVATGHYARRQKNPASGYDLLRGKDPGKDQSYFLARLTQDQVDHVLFPVGELLKSEVREIAKQAELPFPTHKKESQELCFIPDDTKSFLTRQSKNSFVPGPVKDKDGTVYPDQHDGLQLYTIGQRKGLPISGTGTPRYVVGNDKSSNTLIVGEEQHLLGNQLEVKDIILRHHEAKGEVDCEIQIRYRAQAVSGKIQFLKDRAKIVLDGPQKAITPGQSAAFYKNNICFGCGIIV